jgi:hypothetical protein
MRPRANTAVILAWKSPVDGTVSYAFDVAEVSGMDPVTLEISRNEEPKPLHTESIAVGSTARVELGSVRVKKGDFLYLVADAKPRTDSPTTQLENLKITLVKSDE